MTCNWFMRFASKRERELEEESVNKIFGAYMSNTILPTSVIKECVEKDNEMKDKGDLIWREDAEKAIRELYANGLNWASSNAFEAIFAIPAAEKR